MEDTHKSQFGRMFTELLARHRAKTSEQSSKRSGKSAKEAIAFLDLRKTGQGGRDGLAPVTSWEIIPLSLGEDLTLNFGESPKDASVSSLSSILEVNVPEKYYLSVRACEGILRRSGERGKPLDPLLKQALLNTIVFMQSKTTPAECPSDPITPSKPSLDEWGQGGGNVPLVLVPCFGQASYDEYAPTEQAVTLKATGGTYGGGTETLIAVPVQKVFSKGTRPHSKEEGQEWHESQIANTLNVFDMGESRCSEIACIPYTLNIRSGCEGGGKGALISEDKSATLSCNNEQTLFVPTQTENGEVIYLARKLTPTECASLQGFEKDWCALVPHKDSAEYKMWGNGMAFPCMLYIMESVQEVLAERYLDNLFGGDTAEP